MEKEYVYQVDLKWKEGRIGEVSSPELDEVIECATPPEFPKGVANIWSPEHFYAAAINSCYMTTFLAIADNSNVELESFECKTVVRLGKVDGKFIVAESDIEPHVVLKNFEKDEKRITRILQRTKDICLVTNSMKTEFTVKPTVK